MQGGAWQVDGDDAQQCGRQANGDRRRQLFAQHDDAEKHADARAQVALAGHAQ